MLYVLYVTYVKVRLFVWRIAVVCKYIEVGSGVLPPSDLPRSGIAGNVIYCYPTAWVSLFFARTADIYLLGRAPG